MAERAGSVTAANGLPDMLRTEALHLQQLKVKRCIHSEACMIVCRL